MSEKIKKGVLVWITGLSGSGKSTLGRSVYSRLSETNSNIVFLDGDDFREILGNDVGHDPDDRLTNAFRLARMCQFLTGQGIHVVCSTMSLFKEIHKYNREHQKNYLEVFVEVEFDELVRRDQKQLYSKALRGEISNVVGIDLPCDRPEQCNLIIDNNTLDSLDEKTNKILLLVDKILSSDANSLKHRK